MKFGLETKVGFFVIAATLIISVMGIVFGKIDFTREDGFTVEFQITDASGLQEGAAVLFRGVRVGTLKGVTFNDTELIATVFIKEKMQIPNNVTFAIRQAGFIGQKHVELVTDNQKPATGYLSAGQRYVGNQMTVSMDDVMAKVNGMTEQITILVKALNDVVGKDDTKKALTETIDHIRSISANIDRLVASNDTKINEIIESSKNLLTNIDKLVEANKNNVNKSVDNIAEITSYLKDFSKSLDNITANNKENLDDSIKNIKEITEKLNSTMDGINNSNGTLGMLINDNKTKEEVQAIISTVNNMTSRVNNYKLFVTFGADYLINATDARGYVNLRLYTKPNTFYQFGVSNTPRTTPTTTTTNFILNPNPGSTAGYPDGIISYESTKTEYSSTKLAFSLQYGHIFKEYVGLRVGIFENSLGLAADIYPLKNDNLTLSLEAFDFGNYNSGFKVYTRAMIRWHFYKGIFLQAGVEDLFNFEKRIYSVGGGIRFSDDDLKYFAGSAATAVSK